MPRPASYSLTQILLHWAIALGVLVNYVFSDGMPRAFDAMMEGKPADGWLSFFHVWVGVAILALVVVRIGVRLARGAPEGQAGTLGLAAKAGHGVLYLLMIAVPIGGAITWFLKYDPTGELHGLGANALMIVAGAHSVVALFHHFYLKDGVLKRMLRPA